MTIDLFDLAHNGAGRYVWAPSGFVLAPLGRLQGGAGLGAAIRAMELETGRPVVWATAQFLTFAEGREPVELDVTVEATGRSTSQARCTVRRDGIEILATHAALGTRDDALDGVWSRPPLVDPPEHCPVFPFFRRGNGDFGDLVELRLAAGRQIADAVDEGGRGSGTSAWWVRCWDDAGHVASPGELTMIGDLAPLAFVDAFGAPFAGNSLDNTIRMGRAAPTGWVLVVAHVDHVSHGFAHAGAELWAEDGTLLASVAQTVVPRQLRNLR